MDGLSGPELQLIVQASPDRYLILAPDLTIVAVSDAYLHATMTKREEIVGRGIFEVFPDNPDDPAATGVENLRASLDRVRERRVPDAMAIQKYDIRRPDGSFEERFWSPVNSPVLGPDGALRFIVHRVEDVTDQVHGQELLHDREERLRLIVEQVRDYAIFMLDAQGRVTTWNGGAERLKGYKAEEIIGRHFSVFYPPDKVASGWPDEELRRAARDGRFEDEGVRVRKDGSTFVANVVITALRDPGGELRGFAKVTRDVTDRFTKAERALGASEERLRIACGAAGLGVFEWHFPADRAVWENERVYEIFGRSPAQGPLTKAELVAGVLHEDDRQRFEAAIVAATSPCGRFEGQFRIRRGDGALRWIEYSAHCDRAREGTVRLVGVVKDVTDEKRAQEALQAENRISGTLVRLGRTFGSELHHEKLVQAVTDEATELTGAEFGAFFHNVVDVKGESYTLYTISGVPRERFSCFPLPRNTAVFEPTFRGVATMRLDDVTRDPRYGKNPPYNGMPEGHLPVRSYLAVPVKSRTGRVLGGLFFGHSRPGVFTEEHERLTEGLAAQAAIALENASLVGELRDSEARLRAVADNIPQLAWIADPSGSITWYNERWFDYTGTTLEEMQGWGWRRVHHPDAIERVEAKWRRSLAEGREWEDTFPLRGRDGTYRWFLSRAVPIHDATGRVVRWFGTNTDVTTELQAKEALESAVHARDVFLSIASHELKTPLTPLTLQLQSLERLAEKANGDGFARKVVEKVAKAERQLAHLDRLVNNLLDVSRLSCDRLRLDVVEFDVSELVGEVVERFRPEFESQKTPLDVALDGGAVGRWDRFRLDQVLTNLLTNALKYGRGKPVEVAVLATEESVSIRVRDHGIGIEAKDRERIFGRFERAVSDLNYGGFGLGLWIARQVLEAMGGRIEVASTPGEGASFTVTLPRAAPVEGGVT